jgi:predicted acylesterase/phospholipase RssA
MNKLTRERKPKIGLALAGGGPLGAVYETGVLMALDESLTGLDLNDIDVYVGVSAGSFITSGLANGITPEEIYRLFIGNQTIDGARLRPEAFLKPAFREYFQRARSVPLLFVDALWRYLSSPIERGAIDSFAGLARAIPTGIFDNDAISHFLDKAFSEHGRSNDFRKLKHKLYAVATDLDTGQSVKFGAPGFDNIPISKAVQASAALPGLFPPVEIDGRYYVDGALKKTLHASVALDEGARLVICINPLVPFDADLARRHGKPEMKKLVESGLPMVLSQTFRAIIHSRLQAGLAKYGRQYRGANVVLFEPGSDDTEMFYTNLFSYSTRKRVCEHAYQRTRQDLLKRRDVLEPIFAKFGIDYDDEALHDAGRTLETRVRRTRGAGGERLHDAALDLADTLNELKHWAGRIVERRGIQ